MTTSSAIDVDSAADRSPRRIATEEAFVTPEVVAGLRALVDAGSDDPDVNLWRSLLDADNRWGSRVLRRLLDLEGERLAIMDRFGIEAQVIGMTCPGVQVFPADAAVRLAADANDRAAEVTAAHPGRFVPLACVAPQAPVAAAEEIGRAVAGLGMHGVIINSHTGGEYLDDERFWPIFEATESLEVPLYLHPRAVSPQMYGPYRTHALEAAIWGYQVETSLHALRLILGGIFDRFPRLQVVLGHMGEGIPYWLYRIDYMQRGGVAFGWRQRIDRPPSEYFHDNFSVTTSGMNWEPPLRLCLDVLGANKVMFAVDYPYQNTEDAVPWVDALELSPAEKVALYEGNARRVFKIET